MAGRTSNPDAAVAAKRKLAAELTGFATPPPLATRVARSHFFFTLGDFVERGGGKMVMVVLASFLPAPTSASVLTSASVSASESATPLLSALCIAGNTFHFPACKDWGWGWGK